MKIALYVIAGLLALYLVGDLVMRVVRKGSAGPAIGPDVAVNELGDALRELVTEKDNPGRIPSAQDGEPDKPTIDYTE